MTKKAMVKEEQHGLYKRSSRVGEKISPGSYSFTVEPKEPISTISTREKAKTRQIEPGLYEVLE